MRLSVTDRDDLVRRLAAAHVLAGSSLSFLEELKVVVRHVDARVSAPWYGSSVKDRGNYEEALRTLEGRSIRSVAYYEIAYSDGTPMWSFDGEALDSLDFGLTLELDDGSLFSFDWGADFAPYGVRISTASLQSGQHAREWDADQRWASLLAVPIVAVATWWLQAETREDPIDYPQAVRLRFASGDAVTISASEDRTGMMDHITVFFDEAEARRMGFGFAEDG